MSEPKVTAHSGTEGVTLELVSSSGEARSCAGYLHWNAAFTGASDTAYCKLQPGFVFLDAGSFKLRVRHKSGRGRKKVVATWRTLWPEWDPKDDALAPEEGKPKIEQRLCDQSELTLQETEPGVFESPPLGLTTFPEDRDVEIDGLKRGARDFPVQFAHPRGWVQLEYPVGKKTIVRKSFRVLEKLHLLHVEAFVCVAKDGTKYFDPQSDSDDADYFVESMRTATLAYAAIGIDLNTFVPGGDGVTVGGYSFRFATTPKDKDLPHFPGDVLHDKRTPGPYPWSDEKVEKVLILRDGAVEAEGTAWNEHDRLIRYPRAYPARNPKAVRVFFTDRGPDDSALGVAAPEGNAAAVYFGQQQGVAVEPAYRSCVVYVQTHKRKAADTLPAVNRDRFKGKFGTGPTTMAHEIGHILGHFRVPGGHSSAEPRQPFLMASGASGGKFRMFDRGVEVRRRIYDHAEYAWRTTMLGEPYLE